MNENVLGLCLAIVAAITLIVVVGMTSNSSRTHALRMAQLGFQQTSVIGQSMPVWQKVP